MQSILGNPTTIEAVGPERQNDAEIPSAQTNFGAVAQQVNWLAVIENLYSLLLLALPFIFLTITADPLNLNKAYLTIVISLLSLVLFFANGVQKGKLGIAGFQSYLGLSVLAVAAVISIFFSINKQNSIFGHFGNYTDSLLFIVSVLIIGFVASNIKLNVRKLLRFFLIGVTISTLISLYVLYGFTLPGIGALPRVFSLAGSIYILMALEVVAVMISLFQLLTAGTMKNKILYSATLIINAAYLLAVIDVSALITLFIGILFLFLYVHKEIPANSKHLFIGILVALGLLAFVHHYPMTRDALGLNNLNTQPRLSVRDSWIVAAETLRDRPFVGSGIGTYINMFSLYRPSTLNAGDNWQARFENPYSDLLLWIGNAGLIGLLAYLAFIGFSAYVLKSLGRNDDTSKLLMLVVSSGLLGLILLGNNPILYVLIFIALGAAIQRSNKTPLNVTSVPALSVFTLFAVVLFGYALFNGYKVYAGQYYFRESLLKNNLGERYQVQALAIQRDPNESVYQRAYISTGIAIASAVSANPNITETEKAEVVNIITQAFNNVRYVTEGFEPFNVANWTLRGDLYAAVIDLAENADQLAIQAYRNALQLEPSNPDLWIKLGSVYYRRKVYNEAISAFVQAVQLKDDYANARYNLAFALRDSNYLADAVTQMEVALRLVPEGTPDHEKASKDLEEFRKLLQEALVKQAEAAQASKEVSGVNNDPATTDQVSSGPLVAPEDQPQPQLESNAQIEGEVDEIVAEESDEETTVPAADGSEVDEDEGQREAPIANPE